MWALKLYKCPLTSQNQLLCKFNHSESTSKNGLIKLIIKREVCAILNGYWERKTVWFSWTVRLSVCIIMNIKTCVHVNCCVIVNRYILHVLSWGCCQSFYIVLMHWVMNLEISSILPFVRTGEDGVCLCSLYNIRSCELDTTNFIYKNISSPAVLKISPILSDYPEKLRFNKD
jgi:hypothetical protein